MRFNKDELSKLIEKYTVEIKDDFVSEVKKKFLEKANIEYEKYNQLNNLYVLGEFFEASTFMSLFKEDINYVLEYSTEYWSNHIINEISNVVDFDKLETN